MRINIKNACKHYDTFDLKDVNISFPDKGLFKLDGKSGSGKTTILRLITGEVKPDKGEVAFDKEVNFSSFISYLPSDNLLDKSTSLMKSKSIIVNMDIPFDNDMFLQLIKAFDFNNKKDKHIKDLSEGNIKIANIIICLSKISSCLLIDEPFSSLDRTAKSILKGLLIDLSKSKCVIFTDHSNSIGKEECDMFYSMADKKAVYNKKAESESTVGSIKESKPAGPTEKSALTRFAMIFHDFTSSISICIFMILFLVISTCCLSFSSLISVKNTKYINDVCASTDPYPYISLVSLCDQAKEKDDTMQILYTFPYYYQSTELNRRALLISHPRVDKGTIEVYDPSEEAKSYVYLFHDKAIVPSKVTDNIFNSNLAYELDLIKDNCDLIFYVSNEDFDSYVSYGFFNNVYDISDETNPVKLAGNMFFEVEQTKDDFNTEISSFKIVIVQDQTNYIGISGQKADYQVNLSFSSFMTTVDKSDDSSKTLFLSLDEFEKMVLAQSKSYQVPSYEILISKNAYQQIKSDSSLQLKSPIGTGMDKAKNTITIFHYSFLGGGILFMVGFVLFFLLIFKKKSNSKLKLKYLGVEAKDASLISQGKYIVTGAFSFLISMIVNFFGPTIFNPILTNMAFGGNFESVILENTLLSKINLPISYTYLNVITFLIVIGVSLITEAFMFLLTRKDKKI